MRSRFLKGDRRRGDGEQGKQGKQGEQGEQREQGEQGEQREQREKTILRLYDEPLKVGLVNY